MASKENNKVLMDHLYGTIYGNCIGDAIGLLTEFMVKEEAVKYYRKQNLEYAMKVNDFHRSRWKDGDWTDDSDQMILIMQSIAHLNGQVDRNDFGKRMTTWRRCGIPECGDVGGMGIGQTTAAVLQHPAFSTDPHAASADAWKRSGELHHRYPAPNGAVMRTSILGIHCYKNIPDVIQNTLEMCKTTHHDPRCVASCVAVTTAIAMMLQQKQQHKSLDVKAISEKSYQYACQFLETEEEKLEIRNYMFPKKLKDLQLADHGKIGYTYKTLGAGFWALNKDKDFRHVIQKLVMEAGDADTNCAVAGALLGCKLGFKALPKSWMKGLVYTEFLEETINKFLANSGYDKDPQSSDAAVNS